MSLECLGLIPGTHSFTLLGIQRVRSLPATLARSHCTASSSCCFPRPVPWKWTTVRKQDSAPAQAKPTALAGRVRPGRSFAFLALYRGCSLVVRTAHLTPKAGAMSLPNAKHPVICAPQRAYTFPTCHSSPWLPSGFAAAPSCLRVAVRYAASPLPASHAASSHCPSLLRCTLSIVHVALAGDRTALAVS